MKYECKDCGSKCELITKNVPEVCIKQRSRVFWKKVEEPTPKPLSEMMLHNFPDWVKVGAWVFNESQGRFASISAIGERIQLLDLTEQKGYMDDVDCLTLARVRPWTFEEAPLEFKTKDDVFILLYIQDKQEWGYWAKKECEEYTLAEVAKEQIQIDGSPCGVLEKEEVAR